MLFFPVVLLLAGVLFGTVRLRRGTVATGPRLDADPTASRVTGEVHAGEEQVLIHLARSLELATGRREVPYGGIYIAGSTGTVLKLASRSEIGRGFEGEVRVRRDRRSTLAEYFILRVPGDETLHRRIAHLDGEIAAALRRLDPDARVRVAAQTDDAARSRRFLSPRA